MDLSKFERQLRILELLVNNDQLTPQEIADRMNISTRSAYRYIKFFENLGFDVFNDHGIYSIGNSSPFIAALTQKMHFTSDELQTLGQILGKCDKNDPVVNRIRHKFRNVYGLEFDDEAFKYDQRIGKNIEVLKNAIKLRHQCILQQYQSLSSKQTKDRVVEPYQMLSNSNEVRCYELESGLCKTFKIARINGQVIDRERHAEHRDQYTHYYTDVFGFAADKTTRVILRLSLLSKTILMEEFGVNEERFVMEDANHFLISLPVCNVKGIGRFVLGLIDEVEIVKGDFLKNYIREQIMNHGFTATK